MKWLTLIYILIANTAFAIVDGEIITTNDYRQSVALVFNKEIYCSGTLIGLRVVATAAHCINLGAKAFKVPVEDFKKQTWIYIGETDNASDLPMISPQFKSSRIVIHPINDSIYSDIALVELAEDVDLKKWSINPAAIAIPTKDLLGKNLIHVGYGQITMNGVKGNKAVMQLPLKQLNGWNGLGVGEANVKGPSACHGDSGGSAYMADKTGKLKFVGIEYALGSNNCGQTDTFFVPLTESIIEWMKSINRSLFF